MCPSQALEPTIALIQTWAQASSGLALKYISVHQPQII